MREKILSFLDCGFEVNLYEAAYENLKDEQNKLRFNNYAYAMRELVRAFLARLSPDKNVLLCSWYKDEGQGLGKVTRRQRAHYAVQGGFSDDFVKKSLNLDVQKMHTALRLEIDALSKYTHIEPNTFNLSKSEVCHRVSGLEKALFDLCSMIKEFRFQIIESVCERIDNLLVNEALNEGLQYLEEIAPRYALDQVCSEEVQVIDITHNQIIYSAEGFVAVELQWGSNSDVRKGDGLIANDSFPFHAMLHSPIDHLDKLVVDLDHFYLDTRSWSDDRFE